MYLPTHSVNIKFALACSCGVLAVARASANWAQSCSKPIVNSSKYQRRGLYEPHPIPHPTTNLGHIVSVVSNFDSWWADMRFVAVNGCSRG